jgi:hypothetical protein
VLSYVATLCCTNVFLPETLLLDGLGLNGTLPSSLGNLRNMHRFEILRHIHFHALNPS